MFFQRGKRKANASIAIVDARSQRKTNVNLPAPISLENSQTEDSSEAEVDVDGFEGSEANINFDDEHLSSCSEYDGDLDVKGAQQTYKKRRERLTSNWEKIRLKLLKTSVALEGFLPPTCSEATCQDPTETRCRDCGFTSYYCRKCCDRIHKDKLHFHGCQILKEGCWIDYNVPERVLCNARHNCDGTYLRPITVVSLNGSHHEILFEYCNCYTVPESLLHCGVWPATPVEPSVAFTLDLMEMTLRLMMECQVSIHDMLKTLDFFKNPLLKSKKIYDQFIDSFEEYRYHLRTRKTYNIESNDVISDAIECPACPKTDGKSFLSLDACFGLPRKKASGVSYREPLSAKMYFHEQQDVDQFMMNYPRSTKEPTRSKLILGHMDGSFHIFPFYVSITPQETK